MPADPSRAVFLSYAREDSENARRLADALRAFGVEVWFDQNELRGGDAWDAKIKKQIRECALFVPMVSAQTQARAEGYFRREWKLAVERTQDMAAGVAFLVPLVIDDTAEADAAVPEEFMRVHWTRLAQGVPSSEFLEQIKRLLDAPRIPTAVGATRTSPPFPSAPAAPAALAQQSRPAIYTVGAVAVAAVAAAVFLAVRTPKPADAAGTAAKSSAPTAADAVSSAVKSGASVSAPAAAPASDKSIAVLPFENRSEGKEIAFFTDGVHDDILTNLSNLRELRVVSRTSVAQYRGTTKPMRQIGQELGVAYVLEGGVQRAANKVRVTAQLIRAATDDHVWAKNFDRDLTDIFAIQSEIAQAIAEALQAALSPQERKLLERRPTNNAAAYDLFLKARADFRSFQIVNPESVVAQLVEAVQLDPNFAQAWAQLAAQHAAMRMDADSSSARLEKARAAMETALRLAPDDPFVIEAQGDYYYRGFRDYVRAAEHYRRVLVLRPNSPDTVGNLGLLYRRQGNWDEAVTHLRRAVELDPRSFLRGTLTAHYFFMRRYDEAAAELRRVIELNPEDISWQLYLAAATFARNGSTAEGDAWSARHAARADAEACYWRKLWARWRGDFDTAIMLHAVHPFWADLGTPRWSQEFDAATDWIGRGDEATARAQLEKILPAIEEHLARDPGNRLAWYNAGLTYAILGQRERALAAERKIAELLPESLDAVEGPAASAQRAGLLAWAGEKDKALAELARLLRTPYGGHVHVVRRLNDWRPLHGDPRFEALLQDPKNNAPLF